MAQSKAMADSQASRIPRHVAIIMDGNGRWAKKRLLPRSAGHNAGMNRMIGLSERAKQLGIHYLTVYALSTENLARPKDELDGLYSLIKKYFLKNVDKLIKGGAALRVIGDLSLLPEDVRTVIEDGVARSPEEAEFTFVIALAYGSRREIVGACGAAAAKGLAITEETLSANLYTGGIPDPDLIIRTGGELRLSNFLLWQAAYAELYFSDVLFPDFSDECLDDAVAEFSRRTRRFGKV